MGWAEARTQLRSIVEGTTPSTKTRAVSGADRFRFSEKVPLDVATAVASRIFGFRLVSIGGIFGGITANLPRRQRLRAELVVMYKGDIDVDAQQVCLAKDHVELCTRIFNQGNWNQPTSTIEALSLGGDVIGPATIERIMLDPATPKIDQVTMTISFDLEVTES